MSLVPISRAPDGDILPLVSGNVETTRRGKGPLAKISFPSSCPPAGAEEVRPRREAVSGSGSGLVTYVTGGDERRLGRGGALAYAFL